MHYKCKKCGFELDSGTIAVDVKFLDSIKEHDKTHREKYDGTYR